MAKKTLNIGMVGYGFMGRAHSNAWRKVVEFLRHRLPAGAEGGRRRATPEKAQGLRRDVGLRVDRDRLAQADRAQGHRRDRHLHAERHATPRSPSPRPRPARWCSARSRSPARAKEGLPMVEAVEKAGVPNMVWYNYRRVPAVSLHQADRRRRASSARSITTARSSCRTGPSRRTCRRAAPAPGGSTSRPRARASPATCSPIASTPRIWINGSIDSLTAMTETFVKKRKHALTGKVQDVGIDDAAAVLTPLRQRLARHLRVDPLRARPQGALHAGDQRRARLARLGPARPQPRAMVRPSRSRARCAAGPRSSSPTATIPISANGGCPA